MSVATTYAIKALDDPCATARAPHSWVTIEMVPTKYCYAFFINRPRWALRQHGQIAIQHGALYVVGFQRLEPGALTLNYNWIAVVDVEAFYQQCIVVLIVIPSRKLETAATSPGNGPITRIVPYHPVPNDLADGDLADVGLPCRLLEYRHYRQRVRVDDLHLVVERILSKHDLGAK